MAGKFKIGKKIQAVDELGRWANGRVQEIDEDGRYLVSFPGYPEDDLFVEPEFVREAVLPMEQQFRDDPEKLSGKRRENTRLLRTNRSLIQSCQRGDTISTSAGQKVVHIIDPFHLTLMEADGTVIDFEDILPDPCSEKTAKKRKPSSQEKRPTKRKNQVPVARTANQVQQQQEAAEHPVESVHQSQVLHEEDKVSDGLVYAIGPFSCGDIAVVADLNINVLIREINIFQETAITSPILHEQPVDDVTITLPLKKVTCSPVRPKGKTRKEGEKLKDQAYKATAINLKNAEYRNRFFRNQRKYSILAAIQKAFKGRLSQRAFDLGPIIPGIDDELVPLLDRSMTYSYRSSNLGMLDVLLGSNWDMNTSGGLTKFVTSLKLHLSKGDQLSGLVKIGEYPGEVSCRESIKNYIKS